MSEKLSDKFKGVKINMDEIKKENSRKDSYLILLNEYEEVLGSYNITGQTRTALGDFRVVPFTSFYLLKHKAKKLESELEIAIEALGFASIEKASRREVSFHARQALEKIKEKENG